MSDAGSRLTYGRIEGDAEARIGNLKGAVRLVDDLFADRVPRGSQHVLSLLEGLSHRSQPDPDLLSLIGTAQSVSVNHLGLLRTSTDGSTRSKTYA
ncbi:MAG: hypothetical protein WCC30_05080, partial [Candidatus Dormiibacterota bacterium]